MPPFNDKELSAMAKEARSQKTPDGIDVLGHRGFPVLNGAIDLTGGIKGPCQISFIDLGKNTAKAILRQEIVPVLEAQYPNRHVIRPDIDNPNAVHPVVTIKITDRDGKIDGDQYQVLWDLISNISQRNKQDAPTRGITQKKSIERLKKKPSLADPEVCREKANETVNTLCQSIAGEIKQQMFDAIQINRRGLNSAATLNTIVSNLPALSYRQRLRNDLQHRFEKENLPMPLKAHREVWQQAISSVVDESLGMLGQKIINAIAPLFNPDEKGRLHINTYRFENALIGLQSDAGGLDDRIATLTRDAVVPLYKNTSGKQR